jgi:hypothetical protein
MKSDWNSKASKSGMLLCGISQRRRALEPATQWNSGHVTYSSKMKHEIPRPDPGHGLLAELFSFVNTFR